MVETIDVFEFHNFFFPIFYLLVVRMTIYKSLLPHSEPSFHATELLLDFIEPRALIG